MQVNSQSFNVPTSSPLFLSLCSKDFRDCSNLNPFNITGPGSYDVGPNASQFMSMASDGVDDYLHISYGPIDSYLFEPDLAPFVPHAMLLEVTSNGFGGYAGHLAYEGVPEPSSLSLMLVMIIGLIWRRFRH